MRRLKLILRGRKGSAMTEAAIVFPVMILTVMLLVRTLAFFADILDTGIGEHMQALTEWDGYSGMPIKVHVTKRSITLVKGGLLRSAASKEIETRTYLINEDMIVRTGGLGD